MKIFPKVTVIMPTKDRLKFLPLAVWNFNRQTYPYKEFVVIDSSEEGLSSTDINFLCLDNVGCFYLKVLPSTSLGEARNLGCKLANGALIAHMDDDDFYSKTYLESSIHALIGFKKEIVGFHSWYYYDTLTELGYYYTHPRKPYATGATQVYTKDFWKDNHFPSISQGEDRVFSDTAAKAGVLQSFAGGHDFVARIHDGNTNLTSAIARKHPDFKPSAMPESFLKSPLERVTR